VGSWYSITVPPFVARDHARDDREGRRHPKVDDRGGVSRRDRPSMPDRKGRRVLPQQPHDPCTRDRLGAVGRAELVEDVADVLLDRIEDHDQLIGDLLV
jgi:hypothetical protein